MLPSGRLLLSGRAGLRSGNGGSTKLDVIGTDTGGWELLEAPNGGMPVNELIVYSGPEGCAEFYVDYVAVPIGIGTQQTECNGGG